MVRGGWRGLRAFAVAIGAAQLAACTLPPVPGIADGGSVGSGRSDSPTRDAAPVSDGFSAPVQDARTGDATYDSGLDVSIDAQRDVVSADTGVDAGATVCTPSSGCPIGGICVNGACSPCAPTTCATENVSCGAIDDGCGQMLECGTCTPPSSCGGGGSPGACGCSPSTCGTLGATCGAPSNGCGGALSCGSCTVPDTCVSGTCTTPCGTLAPGGSLSAGAELISCDRRFTLVMQGNDGNLVLYFGATALWNAMTEVHPGATADMQIDGNFVVYSPTHAALWNAMTSGHPGAFLLLQNDGNLVVFSPAGAALWNSGTGGH